VVLTRFLHTLPVCSPPARDTPRLVAVAYLTSIRSPPARNTTGSVASANLIDMAKRLIDAVANVATLDPGVRQLRAMLP
jgi:hypothetical protein